MTKPRTRLFVAAAALLMLSTGAQASFVINLNFVSGLTPAHQAVFTGAKNYWESVITGYQGGISLTGFTVNATGGNIDGLGGVLGSAGPDSFTSQGGFKLTTSGSMFFDLQDIDALSVGDFTDVIKHEMGHVIGFGTLWEMNSVYTNNSGCFTGANALTQYRSEFNVPGANCVPVELGGGGGTADGHWNEVDGGAGDSSDPFRNELMSGWLNSGNFVSRTTLGSFQDIGYAVDFGDPAPPDGTVPVPGTLALALAALPMLLVANRRRKAALAI